jgi:hypothetical protein
LPPAGVPGVTAPGLSTAQPFVRIAPRHSLQDLIFKRYAFGVIFLEPSVRGFFVHKNFEMAGIANTVSGIDIDSTRPRSHSANIASAGQELRPASLFSENGLAHFQRVATSRR